jgi:homoserine kinase type II
MALLTHLSFEAAALLLAGYGLQLTRLVPLEAGSVNSNFFLEAKGGDGIVKELFARIYEEQGKDGALFELRLNELFHAEGIPVARPVRRTDGSLLAFHGSKPFAVYERLRGEVTCQKGVTSVMTRSVGRALARVHLAPLSDLEVGPSRFDFDGILERLERVRESQREELLPAVSVLTRLADELRKSRSQSLPAGLIHGDLFRDNVLLREGEVVGLLDFESASKGPFIYDLMVTLLAWCFGDALVGDLARSMVEGYCEVRPLVPSEIAAIELEGGVACLRFASTRLTDFSLRVPSGVRPARDYQRFLQRLEMLRSGELRRALSGIL